MKDGEGQRSQPRSNSPADATSDGVLAGCMAGNDTKISREICPGGAQAPTGVPSLATDKSARVVAEVGAAGSSVDLWDTTTQGEQSGSACIQATKRSEGPGDGRPKRIKTPAEKIRKLQIALYRKAKAEPRGHRISEPTKGYSESRVRENRPHGLMRGGAAPAALPTLRLQ